MLLNILWRSLRGTGKHQAMLKMETFSFSTTQSSKSAEFSFTCRKPCTRRTKQSHLRINENENAIGVMAFERAKAWNLWSIRCQLPISLFFHFLPRGFNKNHRNIKNPPSIALIVVGPIFMVARTFAFMPKLEGENELVVAWRYFWRSFFN